ncbi:MAG: hypothetical protein BWY82_00233 [Verrucomicrobia bacterium ADurb.Bin474]|nr:MAG: hypothetical protein BWY82_00233 [Verrucomicrobia bacterium ADurb.Bin474]
MGRRRYPRKDADLMSPCLQVGSERRPDQAGSSRNQDAAGAWIPALDDCKIILKGPILVTETIK